MECFYVLFFLSILPTKHQPSHDPLGPFFHNCSKVSHGKLSSKQPSGLSIESWIPVAADSYVSWFCHSEHVKWCTVMQSQIWLQYNLLGMHTTMMAVMLLAKLLLFMAPSLFYILVKQWFLLHLFSQNGRASIGHSVPPFSSYLPVSRWYNHSWLIQGIVRTSSFCPTGATNKQSA